MSNRRIGWIIAGIIIVILSFNIIGSYNRLVSLSEDVETKLSQVDNQLQRRNDLIPNLVETVKGFAAHEEEVIQSVTEARS